VKAAFDGYLTLKAKYEDTTKKDPKWVRGKWRVGRQRVGFSKAIRRLELTENVKRRLLDRLREAVDRVSQLEEQVTRLVVKSEGRLSEEQKKVIKRDIQEKKQALRDLQDDFGSTTADLKRTLDSVLIGEIQPSGRRRNSSSPTSASWSRSPRSTPIAVCSSSTSSRRATSA
jgi:hypothetical protein